MSVLVQGEALAPSWFFDRKALRGLALEQREGYRVARPFPHAVFDGFLGDATALELAQRFPGPEHPAWIRRDYAEQSARFGQLQRAGFEGVDPGLRHLLAELSALAFLDFLGSLTGIEGLIPDAHFKGAGLSLTLPSGHLALHADFDRDGRRQLQRKLTVLYYFGAGWQPQWGGALELWDESCTRCEASYLPVLDRLVVMAHGDTYWHGHPQPLACPDGRFRAALAAYYYIASPPAEAVARGEGRGHGAIWAVAEPPKTK